MSEMLVLDHTGDTKTVWDANNPDDVNAAREQFNALKKKGYIAYRVKKKGAKGEIMRDFDPDAESMILSPPMAGG
jgi:hypothetical protein